MGGAVFHQVPESLTICDTPDCRMIIDDGETLCLECRQQQIKRMTAGRRTVAILLLTTSVAATARSLVR